MQMRKFMHTKVTMNWGKRKRGAPEERVRKRKRREDEAIKKSVKKGWMWREKGGAEFGKALNDRRGEGGIDWGTYIHTYIQGLIKASQTGLNIPYLCIKVNKLKEKFLFIPHLFLTFFFFVQFRTHGICIMRLPMVIILWVCAHNLVALFSKFIFEITKIIYLLFSNHCFTI